MNIPRLKSIFRLSISLAKANFKLRNEGAVLGIFWYLLEPFLMFLILLYVFSSRMAKVDNYPIYLLIGLIVYNLFGNATVQGSRAIIDNAKFIKSLKMEYEPLVISVVMLFIVNHIFEIILLVCFMLFFGLHPGGVLFYPLLLFFYSIFICGICFFLSAVSVRIVDIGNVWRVLIRILWFATPIFYVIKTNSIQFKLNPLAQFIQAARSLIIDAKFPSPWVMLSIIIVSFSSLALGLFVFNLNKKQFPERI